MKKISILLCALLCLLSCKDKAPDNKKAIKPITLDLTTLKITPMADTSLGKDNNIDTLEVTEKGIFIRTTLDRENPFPYTAIDMHAQHNWQDLHAYDSIRIVFPEKKTAYFEIGLLIPVKGITQEGKRESYAPFSYQGTIHKDTLTIAFELFKVPDWWFVVNKTTPEESIISRDAVQALYFANSHHQTSKIGLDITISDITFLQKGKE